MGAKLCSLCKPKCLNPPDNQRTRRRRRRRCIETSKTQMEKTAMIKARKLTLEDWLLSSPASFKTDYLKRGEVCSFRNSKKKIHPSSVSASATTHVPRRSISEARDSLCLVRPMSDRKDEEGEGEEQGEGKSESLGLSGKTKKKRVSFKLPHDVILYSPEEEDYGCEWDNSEDSFYSPVMDRNCREGSPEEISVTLAVNTLPHVPVSSTF